MVGRGGLYALPALVAILVLLQQPASLLNHDVSWFFTAAGRMAAGGTYLTDFFEMNMPQAVAAYLPPVELSALFGFSPATAVRLWTDTLVLHTVVLVLCIEVRAQRQAVSSPARTAFAVTWLLLALLVVPAYNFGQREHFIVLLGTPLLYALSVPVTALPRLLRLYVAALAALGFFIKPHYAPLPFLLVALAAAREGAWRERLACEVACLTAIGLAIAAWVVACFPDWFTVARWAIDLYGIHGTYFADYFADTGAWLVAVAIGALLALLARPSYRVHAWPVVIAALWSFACYVVQGKGWKYQFLPAAAWAMLAAGNAIVWPIVAASRRELAFNAGALGLAVVLAVMAARDFAVMPRVRELGAEPGPQLLRAPPGSTVYALSTDFYPAFPDVVLLGLHWGSRYSALWPLPGLLKARLNPRDPDSARLLDTYWSEFVGSLGADLNRFRPVRVLYDLDEFRTMLGPDFDLLTLLAEDPRFASAWSHYKPVYEGYGFRVYERVADP